MKEYHSCGHCTKNENGLVEVFFTPKKTLIQWIFNIEPKEEVYEGEGGTEWREKGSSKRVKDSKSLEICRVLCRSQKMLARHHRDMKTVKL